LLMTSNAPTASPPCSPLVICGPPPPNFIHRDHLSPNSRNRSSQPTHSSRDLPPCPTNFNQRWYFLHLLVWNSLQKSLRLHLLLYHINIFTYLSLPTRLPTVLALLLYRFSLSPSTALMECYNLGHLRPLPCSAADYPQLER
jgi:hypothetical protein